MKFSLKNLVLSFGFVCVSGLSAALEYKVAFIPGEISRVQEGVVEVKVTDLSLSFRGVERVVEKSPTRLAISADLATGLEVSKPVTLTLCPRQANRVVCTDAEGKNVILADLGAGRAARLANRAIRFGQSLKAPKRATVVKAAKVAGITLAGVLAGLVAVVSIYAGVTKGAEFKAASSQLQSATSGRDKALAIAKGVGAQVKAPFLVGARHCFQYCSKIKR